MNQTEQYNHAKSILENCLDAIVLAVAEAGPHGAPSGIVYAALMGVGISLDIYTRLVQILVAAGRIRQSGDLLFAV